MPAETDQLTPGQAEPSAPEATEPLKLENTVVLAWLAFGAGVIGGSFLTMFVAPEQSFGELSPLAITVFGLSLGIGGLLAMIVFSLDLITRFRGIASVLAGVGAGVGWVGALLFGIAMRNQGADPGQDSMGEVWAKGIAQAGAALIGVAVVGMIVVSMLMMFQLRAREADALT